MVEVRMCVRHERKSIGSLSLSSPGGGGGGNIDILG